MVDVGDKPVQRRRAVAVSRLKCRAATVRALRAWTLAKGDALAVARVAGIQGAKRTSELIPLCHPLPIDAIAVEFRFPRGGIGVRCTVTTCARTGVEMEALTGAATAALALYDMCKAVDPAMSIEGVRLVEKTKR
jgi:cyclic pyranopterin phosphate synthase